MPGGGVPLHKMSTPILCAWLLVTLLVFGGLTWQAIVEPTPIYIRIFLGIADLLFVVPWLEAGSILCERFRRYRRRA
jgi:hypothetical protein